MVVLEDRSKKETKWKEKRQKTIKKKANLITKTNHLLEMTERISDLKTKCSASQSTLDSNICNKAMGILRHKYRTLKELLVSHRKLKVVKEIRQNQLVVMKDSHNSDVILGQGRFDVFKLMSLSLSGESFNVAVILNGHQKKLLLMKPIFYCAFIIRHSLLFFGVCFLESCITCSY